MFEEAYRSELKWIDYVFINEDIEKLPGMTKKSFISYSKYNVNRRMKAIKLEPLFEKTINPFPWMKNYLSSDDLQEALQETEKTDYLVSQMDLNISEDDISNLLV